jgi:hypothetical protein
VESFPALHRAIQGKLGHDIPRNYRFSEAKATQLALTLENSATPDFGEGSRLFIHQFLNPFLTSFFCASF